MKGSLQHLTIRQLLLTTFIIALSGFYFKAYCADNQTKNIDLFKNEIENSLFKIEIDTICNFSESPQADISTTAEQYLKAAEEGDADAQNSLGICYCNGKGVEKAYSKAVEWFQKAAENGHYQSKIEVSKCYRKGKGVKKDYEKAYQWEYESAVHLSHTIMNMQNH